MKKVNKLLDTIARFTKAEDDDLLEDLEDFDEPDVLIENINKFESATAKLLRDQKKHYIVGFEEYIAKDDSPLTLRTVFESLFPTLVASDEFDRLMSEAAYEFFDASITELVKRLTISIDPEMPMEVLSGRTTAWVEDWASDLGELMKTKSTDGITAAFNKTLNEGKGIPDLVRELEDMPGFDRNRARATAITEILTANSVSQNEAYMQSPAVTGKKWRHSGGKGITPRPTHVALDGTEVLLHETFNVNGFPGEYPRDVNLPAGERIYCHCVLSPVVDPNILRLSKEEKEMYRQQALEEFKYESYKSS